MSSAPRGSGSSTGHGAATNWDGEKTHGEERAGQTRTAQKAWRRQATSGPLEPGGPPRLLPPHAEARQGRYGPRRGVRGRQGAQRASKGRPGAHVVYPHTVRRGALGRVGAHVVCPHTATVTAAYIQSSSVALSLTEGG